MSQPTNGSWNEGENAQDSQPGQDAQPQYDAQPEYSGYQPQQGQGQSLGQGYEAASQSGYGPSQEFGQTQDYSQHDPQADASYGQQQTQQPAYSQSSDPAYGQQQTQQTSYGQGAGYDSQQSYGQQADQGYGQQQTQQSGFGQQFTSGATGVASGAGEGIGDLFSDLQFKKSLTEKLSSLVFLGVIVWAVLHFLSNLFYNFGSEDFAGGSIKHMSTGSAIVHTVTDIVWLVLVVGVIRILIEVALNIARIAKRKD